MNDRATFDEESAPLPAANGGNAHPIINGHHSDDDDHPNGSDRTPLHEPIKDDNDTSILQPSDLLQKIDWHAAREEAIWLVWDLAVPQTLLQLGLIFSSALTASFVGRTMGPLYLDGFTLGNLTGNLFVTSLLQGLFSASDTLSPQAFGAGNHRELGLLAIRGTVASIVVLLPIVALLWGNLEGLFLRLDQDAEVARLATGWFQVFCLGLPSYSISMMMWRFLSAQNIMHPQVVVGVAANLIVLPLCLEVCTAWFGFLGSAAAISSFSILHTLLLGAYLWYFEPHSPDSWPGFGCWREALAWKPMLCYLRLGLGGMLCFVEWIYWEMLVLMAGTFGVIPLSVQTIANMVIEVCAMLPTGLGIAISIRIGSTLSTNVRRAQLLSIWTLLIGTLVFAVLSVLLFVMQHVVVAVFTREPAVVEGCNAIWHKVCFLHWNVGVYGIVMGIATGLGMQWTLGICSLVVLMILGLPAAYYFAIVQGGGLDMIWFWINPPYLLISALLILCFRKTNWHAIARKIIQREHCENGTVNGTDLSQKDPNQSNGGYGATEETHDKPLLEPRHD